MAKRFTDSDKWKKPFLRSLKAPYKLLWLYILDDCDHAGIWQVDIDVAQIRIGETLDLNKAIKAFDKKISIIGSGDKWFINDFIEFQYGELKPENRAHNSVIAILNKYQIKPLTSTLQGDKDMDMDKELDKDKDKPKTELVKFFFEKQLPSDLLSVWSTYEDYRKKKHRFSYFNNDSRLREVNKLLKLSAGDLHTAERIIQQTMDGGWKGLFALKTEAPKQGSTQTKQNYNNRIENF